MLPQHHSFKLGFLRTCRRCSIGRETEAREYGRPHEEDRGTAGNVQEIGLCRVQPVKNALKYAIGESECWNAETLNCQKMSEQMMRRM